MLVKTDGRCFDSVVAQEDSCPTRVLGGNKFYFAQDADRTDCNVFEVPDWCGDQVKRAGHTEKRKNGEFSVDGSVL